MDSWDTLLDQDKLGYIFILCFGEKVTIFSLFCISICFLFFLSFNILSFFALPKFASLLNLSWRMQGNGFLIKQHFVSNKQDQSIVMQNFFSCTVGQAHPQKHSYSTVCQNNTSQMKVFTPKQPLEYSHRHSCEKLLPQMFALPERQTEREQYWILNLSQQHQICVQK